MMQTLAATDTIQLPPRCSTASADDMLSALLASRTRDVSVAIDASRVKSIGQAVLQILIAARTDCARRGRSFAIVDPSTEFLAAARLSRCDHHLDLVTE